ncbi:hypothetical protein CE91St41_28650 [Oscillospiraceae bacterium]|nr:hypothetical protein CE91St40_28650 [Oscillospiraceae bacterium]BDF75976.1 hypothetical protein CE91St41_28650 [Oscillospiraceae bacterium]
MREISLAAAVDREKCKQPPCRRECPAGVNVPLYIDLIRSGKLEEAYRAIRADNPFPSVCGRICPNPCEGECRRGVLDAAVAIRALKRFPGDWLAARGGLPRAPRAADNGKRVAVVGAGPAGLSAAFYLAQKGYAVTVFERQEKPGGMMTYGIPAYRLPKDVLELEIGAIRALGVEIKTGVKVGEDMGLEGLLGAGYGAVLLACGADKERRLGIEGEPLTGVLSGVRFLYWLNVGRPADLARKRVAVIGGGNVAADAARSALRLGASSVTVYYRRTRDDMPAAAEELAEMEREGVTVAPLTAPVRILGEGGRVTGLALVRMEQGAPDATGRRAVSPVEGSEFEAAADVVISAIGYQPDAGTLDESLNVTRQGSVAVDRRTQATSIRGVFAGGDCVTGPTSVIAAVAEGKRAAQSIDRFLGGDGVLSRAEAGELPGASLDGSFVPNDGFTRRVEQPEEDRADGFKESVHGYTLEQALREAERCLHCDIVCHTCQDLCPVLAIKSKQPEVRAFAEVDEDCCSGCGMCEQRCPNQAITLKSREKKLVSAPPVDQTLTETVAEICARAHMQPQQVICYCHRVRAEEVVSAILSGAQTPEDVARMTGARTGCGVLCMTSVLRLLKGAGVTLTAPPGNQWYNGTPTIWTLSDEVLEKYDAEYHLYSDREQMNRLFPGPGQTT